MPGSTFLKSHWGSIAATDFFTVEAWPCFSLTRYCVFFCMDLSSRRVHIAGISECPFGAWMKQMGCNLADPFDGSVADMRYIILNRDSLYTHEFRELLKQVGVKVFRLPSRSPNLDAFAERFVRMIKESCLRQMIFFGERSLRQAINEFVAYYHHERNHQGLKNRQIEPLADVGSLYGSVVCRERLGGVLRYYYRDAA